MLEAASLDQVGLQRPRLPRPCATPEVTNYSPSIFDGRATGARRKWQGCMGDVLLRSLLAGRSMKCACIYNIEPIHLRKRSVQTPVPLSRVSKKARYRTIIDFSQCRSPHAAGTPGANHKAPFSDPTMEGRIESLFSAILASMRRLVHGTPRTNQACHCQALAWSRM